jgi:hypothetical protein
VAVLRGAVSHLTFPAFSPYKPRQFLKRQHDAFGVLSQGSRNLELCV